MPLWVQGQAHYRCHLRCVALVFEGTSTWQDANGSERWVPMVENRQGPSEESRIQPRDACSLAADPKGLAIPQADLRLQGVVIEWHLLEMPCEQR